MTTATMTRPHSSHRDQALMAGATAARADSFDYLCQILADTRALRDMYKTKRQEVSGDGSRTPHPLWDKHYARQHALTAQLAERIEALGGIMTGRPRAMAAQTLIAPQPAGCKDPLTQIVRFLNAHEIILVVSRALAANRSDEAAEALMVADVIPTNEAQVWSLYRHLAWEQSRTGIPQSERGGSGRQKEYTYDYGHDQPHR